MAARGGDRGAGNRQLRAGRWASLQLLAQLQCEIPAVAKVAHGRDPGPQSRFRRGPAMLQHDVVLGVRDVPNWIVAGVQDQMAVTVDKSGKQGDVAQIDYLDTPARVGERLDRNDRPLVDQHYCVSKMVISYSVEQPIPSDPKHASTVTCTGRARLRHPTGAPRPADV